MQEIRDIRVVKNETVAGIVPESWFEWGIGTEEDLASRSPEAVMLTAHDAVTANSRKSQPKLGKQVNQGRHDVHTVSLEQLPEMARPPGPSDQLGGSETKAFAKARNRSLQGAGAIACLWARPTDSLRVIPAAEFVGMERRFLGIEEHVAVRCPSATQSTRTPGTHASVPELERK